MQLPRLHLVTDDDVLRTPGFLDRAAAVLERGARDTALHLRGHATRGGVLYALGELLAATASRSGAQLFLNDRIDVALAVRARGVQLGRRSIPVAHARRLVGGTLRIGVSVHSPAEASRAEADGADFVMAGTIYASASHPDGAHAGVARVADVAASTALPIIAIGGITPVRVGAVLRAGARGVAVLGGVWHAEDPVSAVAAYVDALGGRPEEMTSQDGGVAS